jgi:hypothetical protein
MAMLAAWAVPDLQHRRHGNETDSDMLGVAVIAAALLLLPVAVPEADPVANAAGALAGFVLGLWIRYGSSTSPHAPEHPPRVLDRA